MAIEAATLAAIGTAVQVAGAAGSAYYTSQASQASQRAERLREQQMRLEAFKRRRESMRQSIVANSMARARSVGQGVDMGSSVLFGAYGQTQGEQGRQVSYTNESEGIGRGIFAANRDMASAQASASMFKQAGDLGTALTSNSDKISKVGSQLFSPTSSTVQPNPWGAVVMPYSPPFSGFGELKQEIPSLRLPSGY